MKSYIKDLIFELADKGFEADEIKNIIESRYGEVVLYEQIRDVLKVWEQKRRKEKEAEEVYHIKEEVRGSLPSHIDLLNNYLSFLNNIVNSDEKIINKFQAIKLSIEIISLLWKYSQVESFETQFTKLILEAYDLKNKE